MDIFEKWNEYLDSKNYAKQLNERYDDAGEVTTDVMNMIARIDNEFERRMMDQDLEGVREIRTALVYVIKKLDIR